MENNKPMENRELKDYYLELYHTNPIELKGKLRQQIKYLDSIVSNRKKMETKKYDNLAYFKNDIIPSLNQEEIPVDFKSNKYKTYEEIKSLFPEMLQLISFYEKIHNNGNGKDYASSIKTGSGSSVKIRTRQGSINLQPDGVKLKEHIKEHEIGLTLGELCVALNEDPNFPYFSEPKLSHSTLDKLALQYLDLYRDIRKYETNDGINPEILDERKTNLNYETCKQLGHHFLFDNENTNYLIKVSPKENPNKHKLIKYFNWFEIVSKFSDKKIHSLDHHAFGREKIDLDPETEDPEIINLDQVVEYMGKHSSIPNR